MAKGIVLNHTDSLFVKIENRLPDDESGEASATGIEAAVDLLAVDLLAVEDGEGEAHPERRRKALYKAYFETQLPLFKESHPNLKLSQYKERIFEQWQSSPENPMNQVKKEMTKKG